MVSDRLSASGLHVNPHVDTSDFGQPFAVQQTELQKLFIQRLKQEMDARALTGNAASRMAKRMGYTMSQSTVSRVLAGLQDPTLSLIGTLAEVLGIPAPALFMEPGQIEQRIIRLLPANRQNVVSLPSPYPRIHARKRDETKSEKPRASGRKKDRG